jgi:hypothetical protein
LLLLLLLLCLLSSVSTAVSYRYFGMLLLPKGPEDGWLLSGLAAWLEGLALRTLLGSNELQYRRWQVGFLTQANNSLTLYSTVAVASRRIKCAFHNAAVQALAGGKV